MTAVDKQLDRAMLEVNCLSNIAKANGDLPTMYAANRAWHELEDARKDRAIREVALTNGNQ